MQQAREISFEDTSAAMVGALDHAYMSFYGHARRAIRLVVAMLPLIVLLVGSCKTSQLPAAFGNNAGPAQFRLALFPDRINAHEAAYTPAAGYIARAQGFIAEAPENLMMLTQQEIGYLFGKPTLHRKDADAEVWQYKTSGCVVDFYFYNEKGHQGQSPLSYVDIRLKDEMVPGSALRTRPLETSETSDCLSHVVSRELISSLHV